MKNKKHILIYPAALLLFLMLFTVQNIKSLIQKDSKVSNSGVQKEGENVSSVCPVIQEENQEEDEEYLFIGCNGFY